MFFVNLIVTKKGSEQDLVLTNFPGIIDVTIFPPVGSIVYYLVQSSLLHIYQMFPSVTMYFLNQKLVGMVSVMMLKTSIGLAFRNQIVQ